MIDIEKVIELFKCHEWVKFIIPNCGEREYETVEFSSVIEILEKQLDNGWIPVSKRLPNEYGNYQITNHNEEVEEATFVPSMKRGLIYGWSVCHADGTHFVDNDYVKAWQPLPEPWKESVKE